MALKTLDIGCGNRKRPGAVGIDVNPHSQADIIHDLNVFPYPFPENTFDLIYGFDVLEHLEDIVKTMEEIYRIARQGSQIFIRVPHFTSTLAYGDPTHRHFFNTQSLDYFCGGFPQYQGYSTACFQKKKVFMEFWKFHRVNGVSLLANRFPILYEKLFAFIFPAMNIHFELEVVKKSFLQS